MQTQFANISNLLLVQRLDNSRLAGKLVMSNAFDSKETPLQDREYYLDTATKGLRPILDYRNRPGGHWSGYTVWETLRHLARDLG